MIPDRRKKILFTLLIIIVFRFGSMIPVPFLDPGALTSMVSSTGGIFSYLDMLTGGAFSRSTLFALSISPYITASIVIQLLTVAIPYLENLAKEGEEGKRRLKMCIRDRDKTVVVAVRDSVRHPLYKKIVKRTVKFKAHDEANSCGIGDKVEIMETRRLSADKNWRVVEILEKAK